MGSYTGFVSRLFISAICSAALLFSLSGCGKEKAASTPEENAVTETGAKTGAGTANENDPYQPGAPLPPNHPPMDSIADNTGFADHAPKVAESEMIGHPPEVASSEAKDVEVVIPENIKGKWAAVQLAVTGKDSGKNELTVPIGGKADVSDGVVVVIDAFLPDYTSDFEQATSASDTLNNPAALVHLMKQDKLLAKGWVFKNYPEFNTFNSKEVQIELLDAKPTENVSQE